MRPDQRRVLAREIWRQRLSSLRLIPFLCLVGVIGVFIIFFDPPRAVGYERATITGQGLIQGQYGKTKPFLIVKLRDEGVAQVTPVSSAIHKDGQDICILVFKSIIFSRNTAQAALAEDCEQLP